MASERLAFIDAAVNDAIGRKETPGAVVLVARRGGVVWRKAYGSRALVPAREEMTADTVFDLASLTKVVATATSVMILVERGKVRLADPVSLYIPELKGEGREKVTIEHLLTHRSGYAPDFDLSEQWAGYDEMLKRLYVEPLRSAPGARFVYSDINYITLGEVVRRVSGQTLDVFAAENIFKPLGMKDTGFRRIGAGASPARCCRSQRSRGPRRERLAAHRFGQLKRGRDAPAPHCAASPSAASPASPSAAANSPVSSEKRGRNRASPALSSSRRMARRPAAMSPRRAASRPSKHRAHNCHGRIG